MGPPRIFKDMLTRAAKDAGFIVAGTIKCDRYESAYHRLLNLEKHGHFMPFVPNDMAFRTTPARYGEWVQSVIMALYPYGAPPAKIPEKPSDNWLRGKMARIAWGEDYHYVVERALRDFGKKLQHAGYINTFVPIVDTSPFAEKELAYKAGLGLHGKNNCLIHPGWGSMVLVGGLLVDVDLPTINHYEPDMYAGCATCDRCIDACPGGALSYSQKCSTLDVKRCGAYLTVQKGMIPLENRQIINDYLYGCDICLEVCPENRRDFFGNGLLFWGGRQLAIDELYPKISPIISMDNKSFDQCFGNNAAHWRGKTVMQRNAFIAMGNMQEFEGIPLVLQGFKDSRSVIRAHAVWAAGQIIKNNDNRENRKIRKAMESLKKKETNQVVLYELENVLER